MITSCLISILFLHAFLEVFMSINSINHDDMTDITTSWDKKDDSIAKADSKQMKSAEARRRIETLREIRESGLTLEEARELGLIH